MRQKTRKIERMAARPKFRKNQSIQLMQKW